MAKSNSFWKSPVFIIVVVTGVLILTISLRLTYLFQIFSFDSSANDPTIPSGKIVFTSTLKEPRRFSFVAFKNTRQPDSAIWLFRICGVAGDTLEMRNGDLFVNRMPVDSMFTLSHSFVVHVKDTGGMHLVMSEVVPIDSEQVLITYPDRLMSKRGIAYQRYIVPEDRVDTYLQKVFQQPWNTDHLGPIAVPKGYYFLLGDNRSNAMDSRYIGFIPEKEIKGTVLNF